MTTFCYHHHTTIMSTASTNPCETISMTPGQLSELMRSERASERAKVVQEMNAGGAPAPLVQAPTLSASMPAKHPPTKNKRKRIVLADGTVVKNPTSAYFFYCKKHRTAMKEANPELKSTEVTSKLGAQWNALTNDDKEPYKSLAAKDKARYASQVAEAASVPTDAVAPSTTAASPDAPSTTAFPPVAPPVRPQATLLDVPAETSATMDVQPIPTPLVFPTETANHTTTGA